MGGAWYALSLGLCGVWQRMYLKMITHSLSRPFASSTPCELSSQSAYPSKTSGQLDDMSADLSTMLGTTLSACLTPSPQLTIVPRKKSWLLNIDALVLADRGNIFDAILVAIRGALWDLRIPRTRGIEYEAREDRDSSGHQDGMKALLKQRRKVVTGAEFDLEDSWDEGEHLQNRDALPIGMTLNLVCIR